MSTKKLLLIILPFLFIFNNAVALFIFYTSNQTAQSYQHVLTRVILYENLVKVSEQLVNANYQYILNASDYTYNTVNTSRKELLSLYSELQTLSSLTANDLALNRVKKLLASFIQLEGELIAALAEKQNLAYGTIYENLSQLSRFISDESYKLIGFELNTYQTWYNKILLEMNEIESFGTILVVVNTLLSIILVYWISQRISKPIQKLVNVAEHISQGKLDSKLPQFPEHSEFNILANSFGQMQTNIKRLIETEKEALEKDKLLTQMELEVLQSQINPHFLFNSLNVLSKLALIEGAEKTSDLTVSLSNLFRYNLRQLDRPVSLKDEVEHAKEYFYIQQARFRDRVTFKLDIDKEQLTTLVPVLTLQPILENVFVHGIEGLERSAIITLRVYGQDAYTIIEISDNGVGMDEQTQQALMSYKETAQQRHQSSQQKKSTGLGTRNVFRRIELLYKQDKLISLHSETNIGTTVTIRIPTTEQENNNVSHINS